MKRVIAGILAVMLAILSLAFLLFGCAMFAGISGGIYKAISPGIVFGVLGLRSFWSVLSVANDLWQIAMGKDWLED